MSASSDFDTLVAEEYARFERSADWELRNVKSALTMGASLLNGPQENARLHAVRSILAERRRNRPVAA